MMTTALDAEIRDLAVNESECVSGGKIVVFTVGGLTIVLGSNSSGPWMEVCNSEQCTHYPPLSSTA